jgi:hypothetical protein
MSQLPGIVWVAAAGYAGLLLALCILTAAVSLRTARTRASAWSARRIVALLTLAALPWLIAWLAPIHISATIDGTLQLITWLLAVLLAFALLVLLPLAALISAVVWWRAWRHRSVRDLPPA